MLTLLKIVYQWEITLFKIILLYLVSVSVCSLPIKPSAISVVDKKAETFDSRNVTKEFLDARQYSLKGKLKYSVLSANLKSIVQREYARYFNRSWLNGDDEDDLLHECLLGSSQYYLWWLDINGSVRPGLNSKNDIVLDLSNKGLSERNLSNFVSSNKNHVS